MVFQVYCCHNRLDFSIKLKPSELKNRIFGGILIELVSIGGQPLKRDGDLQVDRLPDSQPVFQFFQLTERCLDQVVIMVLA